MYVMLDKGQRLLTSAVNPHCFSTMETIESHRGDASENRKYRDLEVVNVQRDGLYFV